MTLSAPAPRGGERLLTDLCGGREVTRVPTAIQDPYRSSEANFGVMHKRASHSKMW
jgi:hypothetical protein